MLSFETMNQTNFFLMVYHKLLGHYGPRQWWPADSPFEVAVGAILTQNTNWSNVEKAIANLKQAEALDCRTMSALPRPELERLIRPSGFFRQKAERLQLFSRYLATHYNCKIEQLLQKPLEPLRRELLEQKGIGPETADSILLYAGGRPSFVIDAYTNRLFSRLGRLHGGESYDQIRQLFMSTLPTDVQLYNDYHALIVIHAKTCCRKKPLCEACPLNSNCSCQQENS